MDSRVWTTYKRRVRKALDAYADITDHESACQLAVEIEKHILTLVLEEKGYMETSNED